MALSKIESQRLKRDLTNCWKEMERVTKEKFPNLGRVLGAYDPQVALLQLSSKQTSGLARLFAIGKSELSIERFILDSEWATKLDTKIIKQCKANLGV